RQGFVDPQWNLPRDVTGICIYCNQACPWGFLARPVPERFPVLIFCDRAEPTQTFRCASVIRFLPWLSCFWILLNPTGARLIFCVQENVAKLRIGSRSAPVD